MWQWRMWFCVWYFVFQQQGTVLMPVYNTREVIFNWGVALVFHIFEICESDKLPTLKLCTALPGVFKWLFGWWD